MKILAFETSCDDTCVAVVENGTRVLANIRQAQGEHNQYHGVVPEIAARLHAEHWRGVLDQALKEADLKIEDIDAIAVTQGPGLQTSLLNGTTAASFLSLLYQKPLIPVHHIHGHLCSVFLEREISEIQYPCLTLTVSGGHTSFYRCESPTQITQIGQTLDDAAGEAFDKTAKMLGLDYPGGPIVSKLAEEGDDQAYKLPLIVMAKASLDFSFSGLKAAVYRIVHDENFKKTPSEIKNLCASFQSITAKTFQKKLQRALDQYPDTAQVHFVGGVSANTRIREALDVVARAHCDAPLQVPIDMSYCTDNAAMIASAAYFNYQENPACAKTQFIDADSRLKI